MSEDRALQQLRLNLQQIPDLYALLPAYRLPGSRPVDPEHRTGASNPAHRSLLDWTVVDLLDERVKPDASYTRDDYDLDRMAGTFRQGVLPRLASWVRLVDSELWDVPIEHAEPSETPSVASEAGFLTEHAAWIIEQPWGHELCDETRRIWTDIRRAVGVRDERELRCSECGWYVEERDDRAWAVCTGCGHTWTYANEIDRLNKEQANRMTIVQIAAELKTTPRTLRTVKTEAGIVSIGTMGRQELYDLRQFQTALKKAADRDKSTGRYRKAS